MLIVINPKLFSAVYAYVISTFLIGSIVWILYKIIISQTGFGNAKDNTLRFNGKYISRNTKIMFGFMALIIIRGLEFAITDLNLFGSLIQSFQISGQSIADALRIPALFYLFGIGLMYLYRYTKKADSRPSRSWG